MEQDTLNGELKHQRPGSISLPVEFHLDTPHSRPCLMCFSEWLCCTKLVNMLCPSP
jgi:hypothetical protein